MPPSTQRVLSNILELDPDAQRQYIDARAAFVAHELLAKQAATVRGGMVWKHVKGTDYLVRTSPAGAQKSLGPRTPNAEQIYAEFTARKAKLEDRLRTSKS